MRSHFVRLLAMTVLFSAAAARTSTAQICVAIDAAHDTLSADERTAAVLLVSKQFELAGERVAADNCSTTYLLSHVRLGNTIAVTLSGPVGHRDGTAIGLEDLPALYSQLVRSLLTGHAVGSMAVVDRTNVTAAQDLEPRRLRSDSFWYARLGYAGIFADETVGAPALGFGYRAEFDSLGVDVSFFNYAFHTPATYYGPSSFASTGSLLKLEGMYFTNPKSNQTGYVGAGMSWGSTEANNGQRNAHGSGLQGELTTGYELGRATSVRFFVQADAILPFYSLTSETYTYPARLPNGVYPRPIVTTDHHYTPSLVVSIGIGWQKGRR
jgi:hypothetical protein